MPLSLANRILRNYLAVVTCGVVFTIDPILRDFVTNLYVRCEDTVVVTEDGIENLTQDAPLEPEDAERMMVGDGLLQSFPPA